MLLPLGFLKAQEAGEPRQFGSFDAGVRAGICASQIDGDNYAGYNKVGLTGGLLVTTPLSQKLDAQLELNYCNRGSRDPADPDNGKYHSYRISLHYIDVPLLLKFRAWKLKFELGVCNGIFIASNEQDEFGAVSNSIFDFRRYELALNGGANVPITDRWTLNLRYHRSVIPIANERKLIPWYGFLGGTYNDALLFSVVRYLSSK